MYISSSKERCVQMATYMIETGCTVRTVARRFEISKSTVHKDITVNLKRINPELYTEVKKILDLNKKERHLRGGEATKRKYLNAKTIILND
jgi:putative DeoR family transcriptional regulator (stage III sporulation protein D)